MASVNKDCIVMSTDYNVYSKKATSVEVELNLMCGHVNRVNYSIVLQRQTGKGFVNVTSASGYYSSWVKKKLKIPKGIAGGNFRVMGYFSKEVVYGKGKKRFEKGPNMATPLFLIKR